MLKVTSLQGDFEQQFANSSLCGANNMFYDIFEFLNYIFKWPRVFKKGTRDRIMKNNQLPSLLVKVLSKDMPKPGNHFLVSKVLN